MYESSESEEEKLLEDIVKLKPSHIQREEIHVFDDKTEYSVSEQPNM